MSNLIKVENLNKTFHTGDESLNIFNIKDFTVNENESIAIIGSSGSGKSTFLQILAGLDEPTSGNVFIQGDIANSLVNKDTINIHKIKEKHRNKIRREHFGFIYQKNFLLRDLNVVENLLISKNDKERAVFLLNEVGLYNKKNRYYNELSGGERQRVSICRALINEPKFVFADEPTGALDFKNTEKIWTLFSDIQKVSSFSLVMVTHDRELANNCNKTYELKYKDNTNQLFKI